MRCVGGLRRRVGVVALAAMTAGGPACSGSRGIAQESDARQAAGLVIALGMAGFDGDVNISASGEVEFGLKEAVYARSPGTRMSARGHMNPAAVTPEVMAAYLEALRTIADPASPGLDVAPGPQP